MGQRLDPAGVYPCESGGGDERVEKLVLITETFKRHKCVHGGRLLL